MRGIRLGGLCVLDIRPRAFTPDEQAHLADMADTLETLVRSCAGNERPDCPILHNLETEAYPASGRCSHHAGPHANLNERITS